MLTLHQTVLHSNNYNDCVTKLMSKCSNMFTIEPGGQNICYILHENTHIHTHILPSFFTNILFLANGWNRKTYTSKGQSYVVRTYM